MTSNETASMQLTLTELRARVTEAEAAYGRYCLPVNGVTLASPHQQAQADCVHAAREALRKAEEAERKPRLASVAELQSRVSAGRDRDDDLVRHTRGDMLASIRKMATHSVMIAIDCRPARPAPLIQSVPAVLLSDIEALVREAGE